MSIGRVLVPLSGNRADEPALAVAAAAAQGRGVGIEALAFRDASELAHAFGAEWLPAAMVAEMVAEAEHAIAQRRHRVGMRIDAMVARHGMDRDAVTMVEMGGRPRPAFLARARSADLVVAPHPALDADLLRRGLVRAAWRAGLPVMMAAEGCPDRIGARVCLAWQGAAPSAAWLAAVLPWLRGAAAVAVVAPAGQTSAALCDRLARQGIAAAVERPGRPGSNLVSAARDFGADMLALAPWPAWRLPWRRGLPEPALPVLLAR